MVTVIVTCDHVVIHILQYHEKIGDGGMEFRSQLLGTAGELFDRADDSSEDAAADLRTVRLFCSPRSCRYSGSDGPI